MFVKYKENESNEILGSITNPFKCCSLAMDLYTSSNQLKY